VEFAHKEWRVIKSISFWIAGGIVAIGAFLIASWYYSGEISAQHATIEEKDGTIEQKDETIRTISEERDAANRENDRLHNDVEAYQAANAAKSSPLKDRIKILAQQLLDFSELTRTNSAGNNNYILLSQYRNEWNGRFEPRLDSVLNELDVRGQYSQFIPAGEDYQLPNPDQIKTISSELNRMADALQESDTP
jgi:hypothetical protein